MTITLVGSDLSWLRQIYDRMLLGDLGVPVPETDRRRLLTLRLIDEEGGSMQVTQRGHEEMKRQWA